MFKIIYSVKNSGFINLIKNKKREKILRIISKYRQDSAPFCIFPHKKGKGIEYNQDTQGDKAHYVKNSI